ncbi:MAG: acetamidase/formamidase family protein [Chloroflexi bacterium]|nr:acetamidase/formamidase family protein [Chloroflexota bacterium]
MIKITKQQYVCVMDKNNPPAAKVPCGEPVLFEVEITLRELVDTGKLPEHIDFDTLVQATGPAFIEGAEPGDILIAEFKNLVPYHAGWSAALTTYGMLQDETKKDYTKVVPIRNGKAFWSDKLQVPVKVFPGTVGVAPKGEGVNCVSPGPHGGNMDNTDLTVGARLFLPVAVPGALFQIADIHAVMGDGEVGGTAIETGADVTVEFDLVKGVPIEGPMVEKPEWIALVASEPNLEEAAREASRRARKLVSEIEGLEVEEAICFVSNFGDLKVCQSVNSLRTIEMRLPKWVFSNKKGLEKYGFRWG